ncbi:MAG: hypothetical protein QM804_02570 [Propionicimonas sp.]
MTTATLSRPVPTTAPAVGVSRLSFAGVARSEWIKALSLRSVRSSIILSAALGIVMSLAIGSALRALFADEPITGTEYLTTITSFPASLLALVFGVLGVFLFASEYASGMILSTLTAAPRRGLVMAAKATVLTVLSFLVAAAVVAAGVGIGVVLMPEAAASIGTMQTLTSLLGTSIYLVAIALFSFAAAGILRSTAGAITTMVAVVFLLPTMLQIAGQLVKWQWLDLVANYLPSSLGMRLGMGAVEATMPGTPSYGVALLALAAWVIVPMAVAAKVFFARNAK